MSLQSNCAQFRAVGTPPISGFILIYRHITIESILPRFFHNSEREETAYICGVTYPTVYNGYNQKENKRRNLRKFIYQTIQHFVV